MAMTRAFADTLLAPIDHSKVNTVAKAIRDLARDVGERIAVSHDIDTGVIENLTIVAAMLAANAVETAKIKDDAITSAKILALAVTAAKLAADAVETAKIKDGAVTAGKLAADAVTTVKILDANVTAAKLAEEYVQTTGNETIAGLKTFSTIPKIPTTAPTVDEEVAGKKYVDDEIVANAVSLDADYDSDWFAVAANTVYTKAHSLGVRPSRVKVMYRLAADSTIYFEIACQETHIQTRGAAIGYDTTNIYLAVGNYANPWGSYPIDAVDGADSATGYYRILAWK